MCNYEVAHMKYASGESMTEDTIEREVLISAPRERVWEIITHAEHVGTWFSDAAEIDLRPGGVIVLRWESHGTMYGIIERVDAPQVFSYRWNPFLFDQRPTKEDSTLVEFTLTARGDHTHVRVVESGFQSLARTEDELAEQFGKNSHGWEIQVRDLEHYIQELPAPSHI